MKVTIGQKQFKIKSFFSEEGRKKGLKGVETLPKGHGIALRYKSPTTVTITMEGVLIDLGLIYILNDKVVNIERGTAEGEDIYYEGQVTEVVEINAEEAKGLRVGNSVTWIGEKTEPGRITPAEDIKSYEEDMLILDENGKVQGTMRGLERIHSRVDTKKLYELCVKADKTKKPEDYEKVGKYLVTVINRQESKEIQTIEA